MVQLDAKQKEELEKEKKQEGPEEVEFSDNDEGTTVKQRPLISQSQSQS